MKRLIILATVLVSSFAYSQENNLQPAREEQTHSRSRHVATAGALTSLDVDEASGISDQLTDGEKLWVTHDGKWWYNSSDTTTPNANRVDAGTHGGRFVREVWGKIHSLTTANRTNNEVYSFPSGQSALVYDSTEQKYYRADGNGLLVNPTFTEFLSGGLPGDDTNFAITDLTFTGDRNHDMTGFEMNMSSNDSQVLITGEGSTVFNSLLGASNSTFYNRQGDWSGISYTDGTDTSLVQTEAGYAQITSTGDGGGVGSNTVSTTDADVRLNFAAASPLEIDGDPGTAGQAIISQGAILPPVWGDPTGGGGGMTFSLTGDTGTPETIEDGDTMTVAGGEGIDTIVSATDTLTVDMAINTLGATPGLTGNETIAIYNPTTTNHETILITNLPAGNDTHFANDDLIFDTDHTHDLDGNFVQIVGNAITRLELDEAADRSVLGAAGSSFAVDLQGLELNQGTGNDLRVEGSAGVAGQVLTSNGPATPALWADVGIAIEDEGAAEEPVAKTLNFTGAGVTATGIGGNEVTIDIPGGGGGSNLETQDEGVQVEADTQLINVVGEQLTLSSTATNNVELNGNHTLEYGENLTAGDFIKIGGDGKAYKVATAPTQQIDAITTTDWESIVSGSVRSTDFSLFAMGRVDDDRVMISYWEDGLTSRRFVIGNRSGTSTYSTFGTPVENDNDGGLMTTSDHAISIDNGSTGYTVWTIAGNALTAAGTGVIASRSSGNDRGSRGFLLDGETDQWFVVHMTNDGTIRGVTIDASTPASPVTGTEVSFGSQTTPSTEYTLFMDRVEGNRFIVGWIEEADGSMEAMIVDADPGGSHTSGPVFSFGGTGSARNSNLIMLSASKGIAMWRTGAAGVDSAMCQFDVNPISKAISLDGTPVDEGFNNGSAPALYRVSDTQFCIYTGNSGTISSYIYNVVGANTLTQIDTDSVASKTTVVNRYYGPVIAPQGSNAVAYLHGDQSGLSFIDKTIGQLANLGGLAGTAEETLSAGSTGVVRYPGEVSETQSGLDPGAVYYLTDAVGLTTLQTGTRVGVAQSTTKLNIDVDHAPGNEGGTTGGTGGAGAIAYGGISVEDNATATTLASTSTDFSNAAQVLVFDTNDDENVNVTADHTTDDLEPTVAGYFEVEAEISFSGGNNAVYSMAIFKNDGATQVGPRQTRVINSNGDVGHVSLSGRVRVSSSETLEVWIQREIGTGNATIEDGSLTCTKLSD